MPSRFSQRWTVVTSRWRCAAISFHESSRPSGGLSDGGVPGDGSAIAGSWLVCGRRGLGNPILTLPAGERQRTVFDGKLTERGQFRALPFDHLLKTSDVATVSPSSDLNKSRKEGWYARENSLVSIAECCDCDHGALSRWNCPSDRAQRIRVKDAGPRHVRPNGRFQPTSRSAVRPGPRKQRQRLAVIA